MSTLLERLVGDTSSLGSADWKKPQYLLDAIAKRKKRSRTSKRAFCPTGEGGGVKNDCGGGKASDYDPGHFDIGPDPNGLTEKDLMYSPTVKWTQDHKSLVRDAVKSWKGSPTDMTLHVMSEINGEGIPGSGSGKIMRAQATALLNEVLDNGEPAPTLYRGASIPPEQDPSPLLGWTSKKSVAEAFAKKNGGEVYTLEGASGLDTSKIKAHGMGEAEWIVPHKIPDGYRVAKAEVASVPKPKWMGDVDASGTTNHGTWFLEKNTKQKPTSWRGDDEATTHVVSLVDDDGKVKAFAHADLSDDRTSLYMNYSEVAEPHRGQGVYKSLLDSLSEKFRVVSDEEHNVAPAAKKAYESLGARLDRYGHYVLDTKKKHEGRAFCPNGTGNGITNTCGKGIGINDAEQDFTGQILSGEKTIETRVPNSLKPYIGKTVGIVRTGKGKATLVGVMKIGEPKFYKTRKEFDADYDKHRVGKDSEHYIGSEGKYGYPLSEVKPVKKPVELDTKGHVARVIAKSVKTRELTVVFDLDGESPEHPHESRGDAPAPKKDHIKGSDVNNDGSAKNKSGDISLNESIIASLKSKVEEHNAAMRKAKKPSWTHVSLPALKAVYRRGAGAFSTSHRPGMTRDRWALARVNAFLTLARRGRPENAKYTTDNDLLHSKHPKHSTQARAFCATGEGNGIDNSCGAKTMSAPYKDGGGGSAASPYKYFASESDALKSAVTRWKGDPTDLGIHVQDEIDGLQPPPSGSGTKLREMASALLKEVKENSRPAPTLYRGDNKTTDDNSSALVGWSSNRRVAEKWADRYGGTLQTLEGASGVKLSDIVGKTMDTGEDEWIVLNARPATGGGSSSGKPLPSYANDIEHSMPKSKGFDDPKNSLAWLNPSGTFFPVSGDHGWYAERHGVDGGGDTLLDAGWLRVAGHSGSTMYVGNPSGFTPRGRQLSALKDFAISTDRIKRIIFDNGKSRSGTVLWQSDEARSADCGREDDGKFSSGNKCAGSVDMPKEDPRGRMRYDNGVQTDAARKLYQMGSSEKKLKSLVDAMGGDPKNTTVDMNHPGVDISVADKDGNKLFHVSFENGRARLYPAKDLSEDEIGKVKDAADEAFGGTQADTKVTVYGKASDMKKWESENDAKHKAWEDKYKFSTLLPPHQRPKKWERSIDAKHASLLAFAQSRGFCPNGEGNGVTNTCSSKDGGGEAPSYGKIKSEAASRMKEGEKPSEILDSLGFTNIRLEGEFDKAVSEPSGILHMIPAVRRSTASSVIAAMESAANRVPEMRDAKIAVRTREGHVADYDSRGMSREATVISQATASCDMQTGEISVYFDVDQSLFSKQLNHAVGLLSTPDPSHVIVHEYAHSVHAEGMRQFIANSILEETPNPQSDLDHHHVQIARNILSGKELNKDQLFNYKYLQSLILDNLREEMESSEELRDAVGAVSRYATSHPFEAIAEYWTAVTLGYKKNDKLLDSLCELGHCPIPKQRKTKK